MRTHGEIKWQWKSTLRKDSRPKRVCTAEQGKVFTVLGLNRGIQFHYLAYWTGQFAYQAFEREGEEDFQLEHLPAGYEQGAFLDWKPLKEGEG